MKRMQRCNDSTTQPLILRAQKQFDVGEVRWDSNFWIGGGAFHEAHGLSNQFASSGVVGHEQTSLADHAQGAADDFGPKTLWRLNGPEPGAVQMACDHLSVFRFFDRVGDALGGD